MNHYTSQHPDFAATPTDLATSIGTINHYLAPDPVFLPKAFNQQEYHDAIIRMLTIHRMPFSIIEWDALTQLCLACNPAVNDYLIRSRTTPVRLLLSNFTHYREQLARQLQSAISPIHIQSDLCTSPHRHAILAVCPQWVDKDYRLPKPPLAMPECFGDHSGATQPGLIYEIIKIYGIWSNVGWHTSHNATSNHTCLEELSRLLQVKHQLDPQADTMAIS